MNDEYKLLVLNDTSDDVSPFDVAKKNDHTSSENHGDVSKLSDLVYEEIERKILNQKNLSNYALVTSNDSKLREFERFGISNLKVESGRDLREVSGSDSEVILYKALDAGRGRIVEDTSLVVDGHNVGVNVRWLIDTLNDTLKNRKEYKGQWKVLLGVNDGDVITVYEGVIDGIVKSADMVPSDAFGFDPYFFPVGSHESLYQLEKRGFKDLYSARKKAIDNLLEGKYILSKSVESIPKWVGGYQH